jgi:hypothetical protein
MFSRRLCTLPEAQAPARLDEIRDTRGGFDFKETAVQISVTENTL